jgi:hypothetical protein
VMAYAVPGQVAQVESLRTAQVTVDVRARFHCSPSPRAPDCRGIVACPHFEAADGPG